MTKSKTKQGMPETCIDCDHATYDLLNDKIDYSKPKCSLTNKKHGWEYSCKKWREME